MGLHFQPPPPVPPAAVDDALERIESTILPSIGQMLEGVLEAATTARAGVRPEEHGAELRRVVRELESVTRQMEMLSAAQPPLQRVACEERTSA